MFNDKRKYPRFTPNNLNVNIIVTPMFSGRQLILEGTVVDMSYTGIKIRLQAPVDTDISDSEIKINFILPDSGIRLSIHGRIKHMQNEVDYGMQYVKTHPNNIVDDLMFECVKLAS